MSDWADRPDDAKMGILGNNGIPTPAWDTRAAPQVPVLAQEPTMWQKLQGADSKLYDVIGNIVAPGIEDKGERAQAVMNFASGLLSGNSGDSQMAAFGNAIAGGTKNVNDLRQQFLLRSEMKARIANDAEKMRQQTIAFQQAQEKYTRDEAERVRLKNYYGLNPPAADASPQEKAWYEADPAGYNKWKAEQGAAERKAEQDQRAKIEIELVRNSGRSGPAPIVWKDSDGNPWALDPLTGTMKRITVAETPQQENGMPTTQSPERPPVQVPTVTPRTGATTTPTTSSTTPPVRPNFNAPAKPATHTEPQIASYAYLERMRNATREIADIGLPDDLTAPQILERLTPGGAKNLVRGPSRQRYVQAAEDFVRAKLRRESGASISDKEAQSEMENLFPVYGDSAEVIAQKGRARQQAIRQMETMSAGYAPPATQGGDGSSVRVIDYSKIQKR